MLADGSQEPVWLRLPFQLSLSTGSCLGALIYLHFFSIVSPLPLCFHLLCALRIPQMSVISIWNKKV